MGNLCGSESKPDPSALPGRAVAARPPQSTTSKPPPSAKVGGPPRTLGGGGAAPAVRGDPRRDAADAAEARARAASRPTGKLGQQLNAQKAQTRAETLQQASREERRVRESDEAARARTYN